MPQKLTQKEVKDLLGSKVGRRRKAIFFGKEIENLKKGEGLLVTHKEWKDTTKLKTKPSILNMILKIALHPKSSFT